MKWPIVLVILTCAACGKKDSDHKTPHALPDGDYTVTGPFCNATGKAPRFKTLAASVTLYAFHETSHVVKLRGGRATEVFNHETDPACQLSLERKVGFHSGSQFALRLYRKATWSDASCVLPVRLEREQKTYDSYDRNSAIPDSDNANLELLFEVSRGDDGVYTLLTPDEPSINQRWADDTDFGCEGPDRIKFEWRRQ